MEDKNINILENLCTELKNLFDDRIICLLYYGSNAYNREIKQSSDYDFCLVLDKMHSEDLSKIRKAVKPFYKIDITLHYLQDIELAGWENFHTDNHGVFYLFHLASAKAIIGDNIFLRKIHLISSTEYIESLRRQIIEYFWRLDNAIFTLDDEELIKTDLFRKYSVRILQDILVSRGEISFSEINTISYIDFFNKFIKDKTYIQEKTKKLLFSVINKKINSVNEIINLKKFLYEDFKKVFYYN